MRSRWLALACLQGLAACGPPSLDVPALRDVESLVEVYENPNGEFTRATAGVVGTRFAEIARDLRGRDLRFVADAFSALLEVPLDFEQELPRTSSTSGPNYAPLLPLRDSEFVFVFELQQACPGGGELRLEGVMDDAGMLPVVSGPMRACDLGDRREVDADLAIRLSTRTGRVHPYRIPRSDMLFVLKGQLREPSGGDPRALDLDFGLSLPDSSLTFRVPDGQGRTLLFEVAMTQLFGTIVRLETRLRGAITELSCEISTLDGSGSCRDLQSGEVIRWSSRAASY